MKKRSLKQFAFIIFIAALFLIGMLGLGSALVPCISAAFLAYLLFPVVRTLEHFNIKRTISVLCVFFVVILIFCVTLFWLLPLFFREAKVFIQTFPHYAQVAMDFIQSTLNNLGIPVTIENDFVINQFKHYVSDISSQQIISIASQMRHWVGSLANALITVINIFLFPLLFFYFIYYYEKIVSEFFSLMPPKFVSKSQFYLNKVNTILSGYIRGQFIVALVLALLYSTALSLIGLHFGLFVGLVTGLLSIIPYVGVSVGIIMSLVIVLATQASIAMFIKVIVVFGVVQIIEGLWITPKLVGGRVGLNPLLSLLALIIGGNIGGLWGMLFAIPGAAVIKMIFVELKHAYKSSFVSKKLG